MPRLGRWPTHNASFRLEGKSAHRREQGISAWPTGRLLAIASRWQGRETISHRSPAQLLRNQLRCATPRQHDQQQAGTCHWALRLPQALNQLCSRIVRRPAAAALVAANPFTGRWPHPAVRRAGGKPALIESGLQRQQFAAREGREVARSRRLTPAPSDRRCASSPPASAAAGRVVVAQARAKIHPDQEGRAARIGRQHERAIGEFHQSWPQCGSPRRRKQAALCFSGAQRTSGLLRISWASRVQMSQSRSTQVLGLGYDDGDTRGDDHDDDARSRPTQDDPGRGEAMI